MDGMVLPDFNKPLSKELKKEQTKVDKIYTPFLMKFLGNNGMFTLAIKGLHNMLITRFTRLIEIVEKVYGASIDGNKQDKKNEPSDGDKKKSHWITEKWQKVIKSNFFQKTLGFLKGLASVSFITELIVFLVLLRMGIIQKFLPWILGIIGSAIVSLIKFLPTLLKMFWNLLWNVIPKVLKQIFRAILDMLGLKDPIWGKITDFIAQFLPLLLAIVWAVTVLGPIISSLGAAMAVLSWPLVAAVAAAALIAYLIYDNWKEIEPLISDLFNTLKVFFTDYIVPALPIIKKIGSFLFKALGKFLILQFKIWKFIILLPIKLITGIYNFVMGAIRVFKSGYTILSTLFDSIFIKPIKNLFSKLSKMAAPVLKKLGPVLDFFGNLFNKITSGITSAINTVQKVIGDLLNWLGAIWDYGAVDYMRNTEKIQEAGKTASQSYIVQAASSSATDEQLKKQLNAADYEDVKQLREAAQTMGVSTQRYAEAKQAGLLEKLDKYESGRDAGRAKAMDFDMNRKGTFVLGSK